MNVSVTDQHSRARSIRGWLRAVGSRDYDEREAQLAADELVKARNINVDTKDRVVTLTGVVQSQQEETKALQIARSTRASLMSWTTSLSAYRNPDPHPRADGLIHRPQHRSARLSRTPELRPR